MIPDYRLTVDGRDVTGTVRQPVAAGPRRARPRLVSLGLAEKRGEEADQLDLVLDDTDGGIALPRTGVSITLALGWLGEKLVDKGRFIVDEISHSGPPDLVTVRARAADFTSALATRRDHGHNATTLGAIINQIAARHRLTPRIAPGLASIPVTAKAQSRESDLAFLRRLGREHDATATIKRGALILSPIGAGVTPSGRPLPTVTVDRRDGDRHEYRIEKREEATGVAASWHDRAGAEKRTVTVGAKDGARRLGRTYPTEAAARRAAQAEASRAARQPVSCSLTLALGRPDIMPEQRATLIGYKAEIDATRWLVAEVTHSLGDRGFTTALKLESA